MKYLTVRETAEKWGVDISLVRRFCKQDRLPGAVRTKDGWLIPEVAVRPVRTRLEHTEEEALPELAKTLRKQKKKKSFHGLYDYVVIDLTYSSCRMASNRLTRGQVESIYRKGKIRESFEPLKVSDVIEALNHIHCVDYILDHVMEPLDTRFIRKLHELLMTGTVDAYRQRVRPGEYRTTIPKNMDRPMIQGSQIHSSLTMLIEYYETRAEIERNQILEFHVRFEQIHPFDDGNGRVGRLIMFKECLRHDIMPFILDDKRRSRYLQGIREWFADRYELVDVVMEAQSRFESQIELQKLQKAAEFYQPEEYKEGLKNEDE